MITIFSKITAIFILMAVGFALNKTKFLPGSVIPHLVKLLVWITTPCTIYVSISTRVYDPSILRSTVEMLVFSVVFFLVAMVLGYLLCKKIFNVPEADLGVYLASFCGINNGFMGFPVTQAIFGQHLFYYMVISNIVLNIYIYSFCPLIINMGDKSRKFSLKSLTKTLLNPSALVCFLGMFMLVNGLQLPGILFESVDMIGQITIPLSMLVVGMQLAQSNVSKVLKNYQLVIISFLKVTLVPALMFLVVNWLPIAQEVKIITVFGAAFPCAVIVSAIVLIEKKNSVLAAEMVALTTLMSIISIPVVAFFLSAYYGL